MYAVCMMSPSAAFAAERSLLCCVRFVFNSAASAKCIVRTAAAATRCAMTTLSNERARARAARCNGATLYTCTGLTHCPSPRPTRRSSSRALVAWISELLNQLLIANRFFAYSARAFLSVCVCVCVHFDCQSSNDLNPRGFTRTVVIGCVRGRVCM